MTTTSRPARRMLALLGTAIAGALVLSGCSGTDNAASTTDAAATSDATNAASTTSYPFTFENADGTTTEIPAKPENIFSTSVSTTGTLLSINAPVKYSSTAGNDQFFDQWKSEAESRGVEAASWGAGLPADIENIIAAAPDLIVVSTSGADSVADQINDIKSIAPTIVIDYSKQTWQELAKQLAVPLGLQAEADKVVSDFDAYVADAASKITVPEGTADIVSYSGPDQDNPIGLNTGPQGQLLEALGFTIENPDKAWSTQPGERSDFVFAAYEHITEMKSETTFLLATDSNEEFMSDSVLANLPSVKADQVYPLGATSFRMDYYSATKMVDTVVSELSK